MEEGRKWKIQDLLILLKNSFLAICRGEFLLRLNIGRYFVHIVWTFLIIALFIWFNLSVDNTLAKVEKNKKELKELEIRNSSLEFKLKQMDRRSTVESMLKEMGSDLCESDKPVIELKK